MMVAATMNLEFIYDIVYLFLRNQASAYDAHDLLQLTSLGRMVLKRSNRSVTSEETVQCRITLSLQLEQLTIWMESLQRSIRNQWAVHRTAPCGLPRGVPESSSK